MIAGGSELQVRVRVDQPYRLTRIRNVVGTLRGTDFPDEWIVLGCHYDAWTFGAVDPCCGTATLLGLAEALGAAAAKGYRPRRSILIAHWDCEEHGIIGSTEWVEQFRTLLGSNGVAYINADAAASGPRFGASASPSLKKPIIDATRSVLHPGTQSTLFDLWMGRTPAATSPPIGNLGGGSDHVAFYTLVGVPSGSMSLSGNSPIYHSAYDSFAWYESFGDPTFEFGPTVTRLQAVLATRLANADVLPYDVTRYAVDLERHVASLEKRAKELGRESRFPALREALGPLAKAASDFERARDGWLAKGAPAAADVRSVNTDLIGLEKAFISPGGLQSRPWSRSLYASPDPFSGYASWMLPGLRYELEAVSDPELARWERTYVRAIEDLTRRIAALARRMKP